MIGNALPASYTIAVIPPDHDLTQALTLCVASTPQQVSALHSLAPVWGSMGSGWVVSVYGGIAAVDGTVGYPVAATLIDGLAVTAMHVVVAEASSAATFIAMIELA